MDKKKRQNRSDYNPEKDYIMTSDLEKFDNYTIYDIMGIEYDLKTILFTPNVLPKVKTKVRRRYNEVINYIQDRIKDRENASKIKS